MFEGRRMHQPIQEGLEDYLSGNTETRTYRELEAHLAACPTCREELAPLRAHSRLLRTLRAPEDVEPRPGFYARLMDRIESQTRPTFWADFLEPVFARRLMVSSALLLLLLGGYLFTTDIPVTGQDAATPEAILATHDEPASNFGIDREQDRDKVLVNLTTYSE
jgi:hypothetical protein